MEQIVSDEKTDLIESQFLDFMQHGDDFLKIELLRHAKSWYTKALELNYENDTVEKKIAECDRLLKFEIKVIWIIFAIVLIAALLIFRPGF